MNILPKLKSLSPKHKLLLSGVFATLIVLTLSIYQYLKVKGKVTSTENQKIENILLVDSNIPSTSIEIDSSGEGPLQYPIYQTPAKILNLPLGQHEIYASKVGYGDQKQQISITKGENRLNLVMDKRLSVHLDKYPSDKNISSFQWLDNNRLLVNTNGQLQFLTANGQTIAVSITPPPNQTNSNTSPDGKYSFVMLNDGLNINTNTQSKVDFDPDFTSSAKAAWMGNQNILLIEKQRELPFLDRIYLINVATKKKSLLKVSADMVGRIDFSYPLSVSPDGTKVALKEGKGPIWVLSLY